MKKTKSTAAMPKNILSVLPIRNYDEDLGCFALADGSYLDIMRVIPRDLQNLSEDEIRSEIFGLVKLLKTVAEDIKFVSVNFPLNTSMQREVLERHYEKADDQAKRLWVRRQIEELETVDSVTHTLNFYLFFFGKSEKALLKHRDSVTKYAASGTNPLAERIDKKEKVQVLAKVCNMNTTIDLHYSEEEVPWQ